MTELPAKLLIVDDEPHIRHLLEQIFLQRGHTVRTASDGFSALRLLREWVPDVLVSDLNMPGMSGFELLSVVRRRLAKIYVVASSGAYTRDELPEGVAADAFHPKGTNVKLLVEKVEVSLHEDLRKPRKSTVTAPIWTAQIEKRATGERRAGEVYATISCPECLRALSHVRTEEVMTIHQTECSHCQTPIQYAIVQELDPATSQPYTA